MNVFQGEKNPDAAQRAKSMLAFMDEIREPVLDIGCRNSVGEEIERLTGLKLMNTKGDLNSDDWEIPCEWDGDIGTIICSDVIEHILNPSTFLQSLKERFNDPIIYIFYPRRPEMFWMNTHFHEYSRKRFLYLLDYCGYEVLKYKQEWRKQLSWKFYFTGIRPLLFRWNIGRARSQMYKLRIK